MSDDNRYEQGGGCAFPFIENGPGGETSIADPGMTLRDYFAGQALHNADLCPGQATKRELTNWFGTYRTNIKQAEIAAKQAYEIADAMLAARDTL